MIDKENEASKPKLNRLVKIAVLTYGMAVIVTRIIEFSNYIGYSISMIVTYVAGIEYDRNKPIRSRSSISGRTKYRDRKISCNRG